MPIPGESASIFGRGIIYFSKPLAAARLIEMIILLLLKTINDEAYVKISFYDITYLYF